MIEKLSEQFSTRTLCRVLGCSISAYYSWKKGKSSKREHHKRKLTALIRTTYFGSKKTYGSPRIYKALKAESINCSRSLVIKIMQQQGLAGIQKRKYGATTESEHNLPVAENLLNRDFKAEKANQKWVTDITYIRTNEGWLYLAVVIDLYRSIFQKSRWLVNGYQNENRSRSSSITYSNLPTKARLRTYSSFRQRSSICEL